MNTTQSSKSNLSKTRKLTIIAVLAAMASVLMKFEFPLLPWVPFLKFDFSLTIVLISSFLVGPIAIWPIALIKAGVSLLASSTGGVGQLADLIVTISFAFPFALIYCKYRSAKGMIAGCAVSIVLIAIAGAIANMYILIPAYSLIMPLDKIWGMCGPVIVDMKTYILYGAIPFNITKGFLSAVATFIIYKALSRTPLMKSKSY